MSLFLPFWLMGSKRYNGRVKKYCIGSYKEKKIENTSYWLNFSIRRKESKLIQSIFSNAKKSFLTKTFSEIPRKWCICNIITKMDTFFFLRRKVIYITLFWSVCYFWKEFVYKVIHDHWKLRTSCKQSSYSWYEKDNNYK